MQAARLLLVRCCWPNRCRPVWPVFLLLLFAMPADLAAQGKQSSDIIKFKLGDGYLIIVQAMLNDAGPFNFLLDTGATHTVIDPSLARQLQLPVIGKASLTTVSDVREDQLARLKAVRVGRSEISELGAVIDRLDQVKLKAPGIRGVLGEDFLFELRLSHRLQGAHAAFRRRCSRWGSMSIRADRQLPRRAYHQPLVAGCRVYGCRQWQGAIAVGYRRKDAGIVSGTVRHGPALSDPSLGPDRWHSAAGRMEPRCTLILPSKSARRL